MPSRSRAPRTRPRARASPPILPTFVRAAAAAGLVVGLAGCAPAPAAADRLRDEILAEVDVVADAEVGSAFSGRPDRPVVVLNLYLPVVDEARVVEAVDGSALLAWEGWYRMPGEVSIRLFEGRVRPEHRELQPVDLTPYAPALDKVDFSDSNRALSLDREMLVERFGERRGG